MVQKILEGQLLAEGLRFAIVVSRFNDFITTRLVSGAIDALLRHVMVFESPGPMQVGRSRPADNPRIEVGIEHRSDFGQIAAELGRALEDGLRGRESLRARRLLETLKR